MHKCVVVCLFVVGFFVCFFVVRFVAVVSGGGVDSGCNGGGIGTALHCWYLECDNICTVHVVVLGAELVVVVLESVIIVDVKVVNIVKKLFCKKCLFFLHRPNKIQNIFNFRKVYPDINAIKHSIKYYKQPWPEKNA